MVEGGGSDPEHLDKAVLLGRGGCVVESEVKVAGLWDWVSWLEIADLGEREKCCCIKRCPPG